MARRSEMFRLILPAALLLFSATQPAMTQSLITSAANVRMRAAPETSAMIVSMLPLGTELQRTESLRSSDWIRVRIPSGQEGWIDKSFALAISESTYFQVASRLIESRLKREGDGFPARAELLAFVEVLLGRNFDHEQRARLELLRFRALSSALGPIPFNRARWDDRMSAWIRDRSDEIRYNEPAGSWLIKRDVILARHTEYRTTSSADELAWFMVLNGVPGECEGYLVCYLDRADMVEGEYLRRQPGGKYVAEATARIKPAVEYYQSLSKPDDYFDPKEQCGLLKSRVASLGAALRNSRAPDGAALAAELQGMLKLCD